MNAHVLIAIAVVVTTSRWTGWAVSKLGQPRVLGEMLAGILLGPSLLGVVWVDAVDYLFPPEILESLHVIAELGVVMFMFLVGLEFDPDLLRSNSRKAVVISQASILLPITLGGVLAIWLYPRFGASADRGGFILFISTSMAITAFPVLARVLQETNMLRSRVGTLALTCAAVDDVTAWCLLAAVVATVQSSGAGDVVLTLALSSAFVVGMVFGVRPVMAATTPVPPLWLALVFALTCAWITEQIGIHAIFGAFIAGAVLPKSPEVRTHVRQNVESLTVEMLLPMFFVVIGLATRIDRLTTGYLGAVTALVVAVAIAGKWGGSTLAARVVGESWRDANRIGILLNTRGLTELVILNVGLELGVIDTTMFTIMVLMALITTFMAPPSLALISHITRHDDRALKPTAEARAHVD